jgi:hypothetical protein
MSLMVLKKSLLPVLMTICCFSCEQQKKTKSSSKPSSFADDSMVVGTIVSNDIRLLATGYKGTIVCYLLSDSTTKSLIKVLNNNKSVFKSVTVTKDKTNQPLQYRLVESRQHYRKFRAEFYCFGPSDLSTGTVSFQKPDKIFLTMNGFVDSNQAVIRDLAKSGEQRFTKMIYHIQVPNDSINYKIFFTPVFDEWTIYQPLTDDWLSSIKQ